MFSDLEPITVKQQLSPEELRQAKRRLYCKGSWSNVSSEPDDFECDYNTTIECDDCKYCGPGYGRKDPAAACNQLTE